MESGSDSPARELAERLAKVLGAEGVLTGDAAARYTAQDVVPPVVALPADADGVSAALSIAAELGAAVVPWGGGTRQALGMPPRRCDLVLSVERLCRVLLYDPADLTIVAQAGLTHATLEETLAPAGQMLPLDVPLARQATLGGTLATASAGLRRGFYGAPRDLVLGLRVADAGGVLLKTGGRVVKNVTGYDMTRLYIGSLGTLGVTVEVNLKLVPRPEHEATAIGVFRALDAALGVAEPLAELAVRPSAIAALHAHALPELAALAPEHGDHVLVAARFPGPPPAVARALAEAEAKLHLAGARAVVRLEGEEQQAFWSAATDFAGMRVPTTQAALLRVAVLPLEVGDVLAMGQMLAAEHGVALGWMADAVVGVAWLRLSRDIGHAPRPEREVAAFGQALGAIHSTLVARRRMAVVHV